MALEQDSLAIRTDAEDIRFASEWLGRFCAENNVPDEQIFRLDLCLNEALANIASYGGEAALASPVLLAMAVMADEEQAQASLTVSDSGEPFNPLTVVAQPAAQSLAEAVPGGLGLSMISSCSDQLDYAYLGQKNHLKITVQWARAL